MRRRGPFETVFDYIVWIVGIVAGFVLEFIVFGFIGLIFLDSPQGITTVAILGGIFVGWFAWGLIRDMSS